MHCASLVSHSSRAGLSAPEESSIAGSSYRSVCELEYNDGNGCTPFQILSQNQTVLQAA